jgi:DNA-directed RNA polymerase subunit RPC12/RpoP
MQDTDYISIKDPAIEVKTRKNIKDKKEQKEVAENKEETLKEVEDSKECESYDIVEGYKCKDCGRYVLEEQKSLHSPGHKLEPVKLGVRYKCSKCGKLFTGKLLPLSTCPKCKSKLNSEIIEVVEISNENEKYYVNKKSDKRICNSEKKPDEANKEGK